MKQAPSLKSVVLFVGGFLLVLLVLLPLVMGMTVRPRVQPAQGTQVGVGGGSDEVPDNAEFTKVDELTASSDPASLVDKKVAIENAQVVNVLSSDLFNIASSDGKTVLVAKDPAESQELSPNKQLAVGSMVHVGGTIKYVPDRAVRQEVWDLTAEQTELLGSDQIYIEASNVEVF